MQIKSIWLIISFVVKLYLCEVPLYTVSQKVSPKLDV